MWVGLSLLLKATVKLSANSNLGCCLGLSPCSFGSTAVDLWWQEKLLISWQPGSRVRESVRAYLSQWLTSLRWLQTSLCRVSPWLLQWQWSWKPYQSYTRNCASLTPRVMSQSIQTDTQDKLNLSQIALISWLYPLQQRLKLENLLPLTCALGTVHCWVLNCHSSSVSFTEE